MAGRDFETRCRSCEARITMRVVGTKPDGKPQYHPYDPDRHHARNVSHFDTCPHAEKHRKPRGPSQTVVSFDSPNRRLTEYSQKPREEP